MFKSERIVYRLLQEFYGKDTLILVNHRPDWLKNPKTGYNLELDFYIPSRSVAYEVQGTHHYNKKDKDQQWRDKYKKRMCAKRGVTLVVVCADQRDFYALRNIMKLNVPNTDIQYGFKQRKNPKYRKKRVNKPSQKTQRKTLGSRARMEAAARAQREETQAILRRKAAGV